jgi:hypothetical protein
MQFIQACPAYCGGNKIIFLLLSGGGNVVNTLVYLHPFADGGFAYAILGS